MKASLVLFSLLATFGPGAWGAAVAQEVESAGCADCHNGEHDARLPGPPHKLVEQSVHAGLDCTDCHESITPEGIDPTSARPHGESLEPVNCGGCHDDAAESYQNHGRMKIGKDPDTPACWSCHGTHDIRACSDRQSHVHPINLPSTCRACHTDVDLVERHDELRDEPIKLYESSVHGRASKKGLWVSATCNDCHSAVNPDGTRTAHRILRPGDPDSTIHHFNIPDTCGQCHKAVTKDYWEGIHGQLVKRGSVESPVCTHCHGEHGIIKAHDPRSPVSAARVAEATCAPCHESEVLNERYGVPAGTRRTYVDTYHGLKSKAGEVHVANCASCHGAHRILPYTDLASSIHPDNLQETCGECHPGISAELAQAGIHQPAQEIEAGWPDFVRVLYLWLIAGTIGLMLAHNIADLIRHIKIMRQKPFVVRLTVNETCQHYLLAISFIVLVLSGFSLRFAEAWWVKLIFGWGGGEGFLFRGLVHRIAAVLFAFCCLWHICYLFGHRGWRAMKDMLPAKRDWDDLIHNIAFFLGLRTDRPRFARFSYIEKAEYWALAWGAGIMSLTGVALWFDNYFIQNWTVPKVILDVFLVIHYYEAWLASLAILVWHGYGVIFNPHVYPTNPAWIGGKMPKDMYSHEHPEGPKLKARVQRTFDEDEEEGFVETPVEVHKTPEPMPDKE